MGSCKSKVTLKIFMQHCAQADFYAKIVLHSVDYFPPLTTHAATFLATKVADGLLIYYKKSLDLSQKEKDDLGYLGRYVFYNLYKKFNKTKIYMTKGNQDCMQILKSGKITSFITQAEESMIAKPTTSNLVTILNCGGLWELKASQETISHYQAVLEDSEVDCYNKTLLFDLLTSIIKLHVRVRSFSYAKDVIQRFKVRDRLSKSRALRKEIKRSSSNP
ncbi:uncharacterized protein LOC135687598 [Rhopilema esculentum]|uniref:uncharacterized protein LOC135687598 n=1 Tax=Rhopilema esculentum TaxID=499914 RepID=UPI0031D34221